MGSTRGVIEGYRGRLAPSPTGGMHAGVARTSLCAWLEARASGGVLVLRIEDIDTPRVVMGSAQTIMDELRFLGLDWDEGPHVQSERHALYAAAIETLRKKGLVYACTCSRKEIAQIASAPHGDLGARYPGTCRSGPSHPGRPASLRFRMDPPAPSFVDRIHGACAYEGDVCDDFVLRRADGVYAYQLAVVVDDLAMGISEIVRGDDLLSSTPRQLALYRALSEREPPAFMHVPLMLGTDGRRLSKRFGSKSIGELRALGVSAERIVGALAYTLGLTSDPAASLPAEGLITAWDPAKLPKTPTLFDDAGLLG